MGPEGSCAPAGTLEMGGWGPTGDTDPEGQAGAQAGRVTGRHAVPRVHRQHEAL